MRAAIYNPYLDTLGGGERYTMAFATTLADAGYHVDLQWKNKNIKQKLENRFGIDLENVNTVKDIKRGDGYDIIFWVSDGSIPILRSRHNFLHFQFPFTNVNGKSLINRMKFFRIEKIICNSLFTKKIIDKEYGVNSIVIYPPVDISHIRAKKKENVIVSIGRFSQLTQSKRQDVLIYAFKNLIKGGLKDWRLILAGGSEVGGEKFILKLRRIASGFPIEIIENPSFDVIKSLYGRAKIFWSASGFGVDEHKDPKKVEHFGITVVEAMSSGAIPIVLSAGGHKEIITDKVNGYLWLTKGELVKKTKMLINDKPLYKKISQKSIADSKRYGYKVFEQNVYRLVE